MSTHETFEPPTKREWAHVVRRAVLETIRSKYPCERSTIKAHVGFEIGATEGQVDYALRVLVRQGLVGRPTWCYYLTEKGFYELGGIA